MRYTSNPHKSFAEEQIRLVDVLFIYLALYYVNMALNSELALNRVLLGSTHIEWW